MYAKKSPSVGMSSRASGFVALLHGACLANEAEIESGLRRSTMRTIWGVWTMRGLALMGLRKCGQVLSVFVP
jgi:hypothetical protein